MIEALGKFIDGLVRPSVTTGFVAAIIYMALVQALPEAQSTVNNLGIAVVSFWFGTRTADKQADAVLAAVKKESLMGSNNG